VTAPEVSEHLVKARECLTRARIILEAGVGEDAGRDAYLAGFHAAQAVIRARTSKTAKTHRGVHRIISQLGRTEPPLAALAVFLSQAYNMKAVADYELGPGAGVPLERARDAIDQAGEFIEQVAGLLGQGAAGL
jgi:uncharacterized protein (UPF0332 family)